MAAREAELLPVPYFHVVFTLPSAIGDIAYQNKAVRHTWGSTMMHHPHVHMIVSGGGISRDGSRWVSCRRRFLLPVRVLSELFRG
jgi:hypothetical protein